MTSRSVQRKSYVRNKGGQFSSKGQDIKVGGHVTDGRDIEGGKRPSDLPPRVERRQERKDRADVRQARREVRLDRIEEMTPGQLMKTKARRLEAAEARATRKARREVAQATRSDRRENRQERREERQE